MRDENKKEGRLVDIAIWFALSLPFFIGRIAMEFFGFWVSCGIGLLIFAVILGFGEWLKGRLSNPNSN